MIPQGCGDRQLGEATGWAAHLVRGFLSPRMVETVLTGHQPADLTVRHLARNIEPPVGWPEQASRSSSVIFNSH